MFVRYARTAALQVGAGADPAALEAVPAKLEAIAAHLFDPAAARLLRCRVAGEGERFAEVEGLLHGWLGPLTIAPVRGRQVRADARLRSAPPLSRCDRRQGPLEARAPATAAAGMLPNRPHRPGPARHHPSG